MSRDTTVMLSTQRCNKCKQRKPLDEFSMDPRVINKRQPRCKACKAEDARLRRASKNGGLTDKKVSRKSKLKVKYGLTLEEYDAMRQTQNNRCAICNKFTQKPVIDHCHITGKVRGLLCSNCNSGIGMLGDDPTRVKAALIYLEEGRLTI